MVADERTSSIADQSPTATEYHRMAKLVVTRHQSCDCSSINKSVLASVISRLPDANSWTTNYLYFPAINENDNHATKGAKEGVQWSEEDQ